MAIYEVETEDGQIYEVETEDGTTTPKDSTLPNLEKTEQKIAGRSDLLSQFDIKKEASLNPMTRIPNELALLGGVGQRAEAAIANPAVEMQKGNFNPKNLLDAMVEGAKGRVLGQFGDLVRNTGVGGDYNEALASTTGLLAALKAPDLISAGKFTAKLGKIEKGAVKGGQQVLSGVDQAVKDAVTNKTGFLEDFRSAFYEAKSTAVEKYGQGLEDLAKNNPNTQVNLRSVVDEINQAIALDPKIRNTVNRVPQLAKFLDNPQLSNKVPLKEAQDIVNMVQSRVSSGKLQGVGVRPDDIPLLDVIHDMKTNMVDAFPQLKELRKGYGEVISKFNALRNKFKVGNLENAVKKNMGDSEQQVMAKELLKDSPEILERLRNYSVLRKAGKAALAVSGLGTAYALTR